MVAEWGQRIHQEYPDFTIVGEAWLQKIPITAYFQKDAPNRDGYNSYLPSVTDFPLCFAMNKAFVENDGWTTGLSQLYYVLAQDFLYADPFMNLIFLDNHDLSRFFSNIDKDFQAYKMGLAFLLTTRGIPMIYYGTEILSTGIEHHGHGEIRKDFPGGWKTDKRNAFTAEGRTNKENEAFSYLKKLLQWRNDKKAIHYGSFKHFIPENHVYVYFRNLEDETIMVCLNNSKKPQSLNMERFVECTRNYSSATDIFSGNEYGLNTNILVPARSALILELHP
jgi:glycosidase